MSYKICKIWSVWICYKFSSNENKAFASHFLLIIGLDTSSQNYLSVSCACLTFPWNYREKEMHLWRLKRAPCLRSSSASSVYIPSVSTCWVRRSKALFGCNVLFLRLCGAFRILSRAKSAILSRRVNLKPHVNVGSGSFFCLNCNKRITHYIQSIQGTRCCFSLTRLQHKINNSTNKKLYAEL